LTKPKISLPLYVADKPPGQVRRIFPQVSEINTIIYSGCSKKYL
jgi:hypothetical protein